MRVTLGRARRATFLLAALVLGLTLNTSVRATPSERFAGRVVGILDGDTLTVLQDLQPRRIRLAEIDAPEKSQAFGQRSKESLSALCAGAVAQVHVIGLARTYRQGDTPRLVARVSCRDIDVNAEQLRRGMAWVYDDYVSDRSLYALQSDARRAATGLWADAHPTPPWQWRRLKRNASQE
jgi:endonuclease YncB( thermonuclease family)